MAYTESVTQKKFRLILRKWMDQAGKKQTDLADALNVAQPTVSRIVNGKQDITIDIFAALAEICGKDVYSAMLRMQQDNAVSVYADNGKVSPDLQRWLDHPDVKAFRDVGALGQSEYEAMLALDRAGVFKSKKHEEIQKWFREILYASGRVER